MLQGMCIPQYRGSRGSLFLADLDASAVGSESSEMLALMAHGLEPCQSTYHGTLAGDWRLEALVLRCESASHQKLTVHSNSHLDSQTWQPQTPLHACWQFFGHCCSATPVDTSLIFQLC